MQVDIGSPIAIGDVVAVGEIFDAGSANLLGRRPLPDREEAQRHLRQALRRTCHGLAHRAMILPNIAADARRGEDGDKFLFWPTEFAARHGAPARCKAVQVHAVVNRAQRSQARHQHGATHALLNPTRRAGDKELAPSVDLRFPTPVFRRRITTYGGRNGEIWAVPATRAPTLASE